VFYNVVMDPRALAALAALDDPMRRAVFDLVAHSATAVGRDAAAEALGTSRRVAAFHLDRLAEQGLLAVEYRRPAGRTGPGAGRPAKLYRRIEEEIAVSVPPRHYDVVGELLAAAVAESIDSGAPVQDVLHRTAYQAGKATGTSAGTLFTALQDAGYEPHGGDHDDRALVLRNCPFHRLARQFTALVCGVNVHLLRGIADGAGESTRTAVLDPGPGRCCVRLEPATQ
jgi:predicted ArsR family transcriptional regulator